MILSILNKIFDNKVEIRPHILSDQNEPTKFVFGNSAQQISFSFSKFNGEFVVCVEKCQSMYFRHYMYKLRDLSIESLLSDIEMIHDSIYENLSKIRKEELVGKEFIQLCNELSKLIVKPVEVFQLKEDVTKPVKKSIEKRFLKTFSNIYNLIF